MASESQQGSASAEIEVTDDVILIRRAQSDVMQSVCTLLLQIADNLASARSPWDGEIVNGDSVFLASASKTAEAIRDAVARALKARRA